MSVSTTIRVVVFVTVLNCVCAASADDNRPVFVEITELDARRFRIGLRVPPTIPQFNQPTLELPEFAVERSAVEVDPKLRQDSTEQAYHYYDCPGGLRGESIGIEYPLTPPTVATVIRMSFQEGHSQTVVLPPGESSWQVPATPSRSSVAGDYLRLGMHHIWVGTDHLLFLVCLVCIAGTWKRVLLTITGFTVAHSITLALSALEIVQLPVPPIEAVIALSVVFLATEVAKGRRENFTWKYPITVSSTFGLLHGLGFAAALNEIGLPDTERVTGLLFFNIGVEIGQILFAIPVLMVFAGLRKIAAAWAKRNRQAATPSMGSLAPDLRFEQGLHRCLGYSVGILATFWLFERLAGFVA